MSTKATILDLSKGKIMKILNDQEANQPDVQRMAYLTNGIFRPAVIVKFNMEQNLDKAMFG